MTDSVLLHACCAPCSTQVMRVLSEQYSVTAFFYNPNIQPAAEYDRRRASMMELCARTGDRLLVVADDAGAWEERARGLETEPEGGQRCRACFALRLETTARYAARHGFTCFATTLSISPHKNTDTLNAIGLEIADQYDVQFIAWDFKDDDGFKKSCALSRTFGLYRQKYCGCRFSMRSMKEDNGNPASKNI
jgi:epoxyqueuosine reductase